MAENQSLFINYIKNHFPRLVLAITEKLNDNNQTDLSYMHRTLLGKQYSVDGRWSSLSGEYTRVAADVIALDSSIPLKKRDSLAKAGGEIPKMGMELALNEKQMKDIMTMISLNLPENDIIAKVLADVPRCYTGVLEQNELMFLQGLSTGVALTDDDNVGTGIRVDYGFLDSHKFGVSALWGDASANVVDDVTKVRTAAKNDGTTLRYAYADTATLQALAISDQFKERYAFSQGFVGTKIPNLFVEDVKSYFMSLFGITITEIDRIVKLEKNGIRKDVNPWQSGMITFTAEQQVGDLVWTDLVEMSRPVSGVTYQRADDYILLSKYAVNRPSWKEFTNSQAMCVPIISKVDGIYQLDTKTLEA